MYDSKRLIKACNMEFTIIYLQTLIINKKNSIVLIYI